MNRRTAPESLSGPKPAVRGGTTGIRADGIPPPVKERRRLMGSGGARPIPRPLDGNDMRFRRRAPATDDGPLSNDDLRALLAAAGKRNVDQERRIAVLTGALNRSDANHRLFCTHALQLAEMRRELAGARRSEKVMYRRLRTALATLQQINTAVTQPIQVIKSGDDR